jgi:hypothetical protein
MAISKYVDAKVFFLSFLFGLLCVYVLPTTLQTVVVHPSATTPATVYEDRGGSCFRLEPEPAPCGSDAFTPPMAH